MGARENIPQRAIMHYLAALGGFVWRNNSRVIRLPGRGGKPRPVRFGGLVGSPDVMCILGGRFVAVEVKADAKGEPTDNQRNWGTMCIEAGGVWVCAYSTQQVETALKAAGVIR